MANTAISSALKAEGNQLFGKGDYAAAASVYTCAIAVDETNAVLYANRAACYNRVKQFQQCRDSALKATELDCHYWKGWWRLAQAYDALEQFEDSARAWAVTVVNYPKENLTAAQIAQKEKFVSQAKNARDNGATQGIEHMSRGSGGTAGLVMELPFGKAPWEVGSKMIGPLLAQGNVTSCVHVILNAYDSFEKGMMELRNKDFRKPGV
ncbi:TPR-like protein [Artomyces pyxidatus]|uniref:TPR-like protein n=1 Tax=Artomyces pyxidatus TaxID=48021 RepID=A0ACB8TDF8_9AGAM|nr:TPR-like protein [Artomyces pyxidatus]